MPTWLMSPRPVLLSRFVRTKGEPLRDEVEVFDANPAYAHVRYPNGNESPVSTSDLAPAQLEQDPNTETSTHVVPASDVALLPTAPPNVDADERELFQTKTKPWTWQRLLTKMHELKRLDYDVLAEREGLPNVLGNGQCDVQPTV